MADLLWQPSPERVGRANLSRFIKTIASELDPSVQDYPSLYEFSIRQPEKFWTAIWDFCGIRASGDRDPVLVDANKMPGASWFPNVRVNFAENLLRYRDDRLAIVFRGESGISREWTYAQLYDEVSRLAQALSQEGVRPGDRVAGFMPNIPEAVIAMLATASLGAVWSSCSPDFGTQGVLDRFGQIEPKVLFTAASYAYGKKSLDCLERIRDVAAKLPSVQRVVVAPYLEEPATLAAFPNAVTWRAFTEPFQAQPIDFVRQSWSAPLYILYSSGTTGVPKCIVHGVGGTLIQHLKELVLHADLKREDKLFYYTTCGWMMWNWLVSGLAVGATIVLFDGSPFHPKPEVLWDLVDEVGVTVFGTSAKYISALEKAGVKPRESHKLLALKTVLSTGSPLAPESFDFVYRDIKPRLLLGSISGGTDIVSCFALAAPILPVYRGELQCRGLGMKVEIYDEDGRAIRETPGELVCTAPFPSMPIGFWNDPDGAKYRAAYFERFDNIWCHGDWAELTDREGIVIYGRSDATLNPGGVRIGTAEIYRQVERVEDVLESLCIGQDWQSDVRVVLFVRLREGVVLDDALADRIKKTIRDNTTPRHVPAKIIQVADIPRTISGKIVELAVRNVVHGRPVRNTDALANPDALKLYADLPQLKD
ncbi:acetoacetate--CoA ligase [Ahniella affigens]|uniref:Acetoacetate--CoA ligase n=1 Tax=Ahniella affigens TaxID=2021234 RepID=A0A2P1PS24_9GAMM|nr:acetoacetate--CoA ligase [Ahniella affigens]AVP97641.1 acetoacetate--CoA ligase [Ahniella affigens]